MIQKFHPGGAAQPATALQKSPAATSGHTKTANKITSYPGVAKKNTSYPGVVNEDDSDQYGIMDVSGEGGVQSDGEGEPTSDLLDPFLREESETAASNGSNGSNRSNGSNGNSDSAMANPQPMVSNGSNMPLRVLTPGVNASANASAPKASSSSTMRFGLGGR